MHLYKQFWRLVIKNKFGIIIYSIIFIVMMVILGISVKDSGDNTKEDGTIDIKESLDISYVDADNSILSNALIEYLSKDNVLTDFKDKSEEEINDLLYFEIVTFHIEIPEGLETKVLNNEDVQVEYRTSLQKSAYAYMVENIINSYIGVCGSYVDRGFSLEEAIAKTNEVLNQELDITVYSSEDNFEGSNPKENVIYFVTLYLSYISFGMIALSVGRTIIVSNNEKVSDRIAASPVSESKKSLINTLGLYSFAMCILLVYVIVIYAYGGDTALVKEKGIYLIINTAIVLLYNGSITAVLASMNLKDNVLSMVVNTVGLAMSFICGVFVPLWMLGDEVIRVAKFLPFYWTTRNLSIIYPESGAGMSFDAGVVWQNFGISALYVIVFALLAVMIKRFAKK